MASATRDPLRIMRLLTRFKDGFAVGAADSVRGSTRAATYMDTEESEAFRRGFVDGQKAADDYGSAYRAELEA
jgi:hypothetical protein